MKVLEGLADPVVTLDIVPGGVVLRVSRSITLATTVGCVRHGADTAY